MSEDKLQDAPIGVLMPNPRDAARTVQLMTEHGFRAIACAHLSALCEQVSQGVDCVLVTEEALGGGGAERLATLLGNEPAWSSLPILIVVREGASDRAQEQFASIFRNPMLIERPVRMRSLLSLTRSAMRARQAQRQIRDALLERERQAAELLDQDERLRFALAAGKLGAWEVDLATGNMTCSDICKLNYGRRVEEPFSYAQLVDSVHPLDRERMQRAVEESVATGKLYDIEYRVVWPDGSVHSVMARGRPLYEGHAQPARIVGVSLDITERERLHAALVVSESELARQAEELKRADRQKDEFLAVLAHELRNPLAPISTGLSILGSLPMPPQAERALGIMERQVGHMVRLIDDLLDVSRITTGKLRLKRERVRLDEVLENAVEASQPALSRGGHTLQKNLSPEALYLDADPTRIAQAVSNLLNNAAKYTAQGGEIELTSRREGHEVCISVRDTGVGIPADQLAQVFEMFSQVNRQLARSQGGLGIGLALVKKLVEMHGGQVQAESAGEQRGSTFTVRLPLDQREAPARTGHSVPPPAAAQRRVLVVDDNEDAADLLSFMLEQAGYRASTAHSGEAALAQVPALRPDIVVLDIGLPGMDGYAVAQKLRLELGFEGLLIALTGWGSHEDKQRARAAGFDVHLTKPVAAASLHDALSTASRR